MQQVEHGNIFERASFPPNLLNSIFTRVIKLLPSMNILGIMSFKTLKKVFRHLEFITQGREGAVIYHEGLKQIRFYMGMGGNNVSFYLSIPSKAEWKSETGFSLNSRDEILSYVAEETRKKQAPYCTYQINETDILFIRN